VKQINANLSRLNTRLRETILKAPKQGIVLTKNFEEGEVAMPGSPILSVADFNKVFIKIYIPETDLPFVKLGKEANVNVDGLNKHSPARVVHIASKAEFTPRNVQTKEARARLVYAIRLEMDNLDGILKAGMPAEGTILK
jgi:HlyD family secretion protein